MPCFSLTDCKIPTVNNFCGILTLRTGSLIVGILSLLISINLMYRAVNIYYADAIDSERRIVSLVMGVLYLMISVIFIFAVAAEKMINGLMKFYFLMLLSIILQSCMLFLYAHVDLTTQRKALTIDVLNIILGLILIISGIYGLIVVYSYYKSKVEEAD